MINRSINIKTLLEYLFKEESKKKFNGNEFKQIKDPGEMHHYLHLTLQVIGKGTARTVYLLPNTNWVLKMGGIDKGGAQNKVEVDLYTNPKLKNILAKIIDFHPNYYWIVAERVDPISKEEFKKLTGINIEDLYKYDEPFDSNNQFLNRYFNLTTNSTLWWEELWKLEHWGKTKEGRLVLLDYGVDAQVGNDFY